MAEVDTKMLKKIDKLEIDERVSRLKKQFYDTHLGLGSERITAIMDIWDEVQSDSQEIQRAKFLKAIIEKVPAVIWKDQTLVGGCKYFRGCYPCLDYDSKYLAKVIEGSQTTFGGPVEKGGISKEDLPKIAKAIDFFQGKAIGDKIRKAIDEVVGAEWYDAFLQAGNRHSNESMPVGPNVNDNEKLLKVGLRGIIKECEERIKSWTDNQDYDTDKLDFWKAVIICCDATIALSKKYAARAREMAATEKDPEAKARFLKIAETCEWVPENPARTFLEALQSIIIVHLAILLHEGNSCNTGWGRVDDYLYPYFKRDLDEKRITLQGALDLVCEFLEYNMRLEWMREPLTRDYMQKGVLISLALGGPDKDGKDYSNELSYLILQARGLMGDPEPHVVIRWHKGTDHSGTPHWLMVKAMETNYRIGGGIPQFQNADHIIKYYLSKGVSLEPARLFITHGCSQTQPADALNSWTPSYINIPLALDLALHDGVASKIGKRIAPPLKDPRKCKTFDEFYDLVCQRAVWLVKKHLWLEKIKDKVELDWYRMPLESALKPGCIERGLDFHRGGLSNYLLHYKKDRGTVNVGDSLVAVKKLVYDDKKLSMDELLKALDSNFAGERGEEIRQMCLKAPKYGNEDPEADMMLNRFTKVTGKAIESVNNIFGYPFAVTRNGQAWHFMAGKRLVALPNGRKAGEPLADGSLSPMQGMDKKGPTALLNSALAADFKQAQAAIITLQFPGSLAASPESREKLITMVESYFDRGGSYLQFNIMDVQTLIDAKKHPEKYRTLVVRVGGFSAYFVTLSPEIQDEIISRTRHAF